MNAQIKNRFFVPVLLMLPSLAGQASAAEDWQTRQLLEPSATQQRAEMRGRVYIYDGLHEDTVDRGLDGQFERIENMMFVGVRRTTDAGDDYADDDCD